MLDTEKRGQHHDEEALGDRISRVQGKKRCRWYIPNLNPCSSSGLLLVGGQSCLIGYCGRP